MTDETRPGRLLELAVTDLALIDRLRLPFEPGLNVITGETGAGKSLLIDALGLALGARADTTLVRHGADVARVELMCELCFDMDLGQESLPVILSLVDSKPTSASAVGIPVLMDDIDIANARIEFANGAIANVTASRVSTTPQRRFRVFQPNQYVSIDFGNGEVRRVTKDGAWRDGATPLREETWNLEKGDALLAETKAFVDAIIHDTAPVVSGDDALASLELAEMINADIARRR